MPHVCGFLRDPFILGSCLGDFNAKLGSDWEGAGGAIGKFGLDTVMSQAK